MPRRRGGGNIDALVADADVGNDFRFRQRVHERRIADDLAGDADATIAH
jgi:hypothetical protein